MMSGDLHCGILVYMFFISNEHILTFLLMSVLFNAFIRELVLFTLNELGSCTDFAISLLKCFALLYAGASLQLITGLMGLSHLCNFIKARIFGG